VLGSSRGATKKGKPRFYCENCGAEVPYEEKTCPGCGRHFSAVRCPFCKFVGDEADFKKGCPSCGRLTGSAPSKPKHSSTNRDVSQPLPPWLIVLFGAIVTALLAALVFFIV